MFGVSAVQRHGNYYKGIVTWHQKNYNHIEISVTFLADVFLSFAFSN